MLNQSDSQGNTNVHLDVSKDFVYAADGEPLIKGEVSFYEPVGAFAGLVLAGVLFKKKTGTEYALTLTLGAIAGWLGGALLRTLGKKGAGKPAGVEGGAKPIEANKPANSEFAGSRQSCPDGYYWSTDASGKGKCYKQPL